MSYGYGWFIARVAGSNVPIIYHVGVTFGFIAYNAFYLEDNITIIVLSNLAIAVLIDRVAFLSHLPRFLLRGELAWSILPGKPHGQRE